MASNFVDLFKVLMQFEADDIVKVRRDIERALRNLKIDLALNVDQKELSGLSRRLKVAVERSANINRLFRDIAKSSQEATKGIAGLSGILANYNTTANKIIGNAKKLGVVTRDQNSSLRVAGNFWEEVGRQTFLTTRRYAGFFVVARGVFGGLRQVNSAVTEAIKLNTELSKVLALVNSSTVASGQGSFITNFEGVKELSDDIFELSKRYASNQRDLISASETLAQTGRPLSEIRSIIKDISRTTLLPTFKTTEQTIDGLIAIYRQFGISVSETNNIIDSFFGIASNYAVEVQDLFNVVKRSGAIFSALSDDSKPAIDQLKELAAITAVVIDRTRQSSETVGTGLKTIFGRLERPKVIDFLKEFNIQLVENGKFVGPLEAIQRIQAQLEKIPSNSPQFLKIVEQVSGLRQLDKAVPLIREAAKASEVLAVAQTGSAQASQALIDRQADLGVQLTNVFNTYKQFVQELVNSTGFQLAARGVLELSRAFGEFLRTVQPIIPILSFLAAYKFSGGIISSLSRGLSPSGKGLDFKKFIGLPFARGGLVPSLLTPGETVISPENVKKIGLRNLHKLNNGNYTVPGFGNSDSVPANLQSGSFVLRKRFARGGQVSNLPLHFQNLNIQDNLDAQKVVREFVEIFSEGSNRLKNVIQEVRSIFFNSRSVADALEKLSNKISQAQNINPQKGIGSFVRATKGIDPYAVSFAIKESQSIAGENSARLLTQLNRYFGIFKGVPGGVNLAVRESRAQSFGDPNKQYELFSNFAIQLERALPENVKARKAARSARLSNERQLIGNFVSAAKAKGFTDQQIGSIIGDVRKTVGFGNVGRATQALSHGANSLVQERKNVNIIRGIVNNRLGVGHLLGRRVIDEPGSLISRIAANGKYANKLRSRSIEIGQEFKSVGELFGDLPERLERVFNNVLKKTDTTVTLQKSLIQYLRQLHPAFDPKLLTVFHPTLTGRKVTGTALSTSVAQVSPEFFGNTISRNFNPAILKTLSPVEYLKIVKQNSKLLEESSSTFVKALGKAGSALKIAILPISLLADYQRSKTRTDTSSTFGERAFAFGTDAFNTGLFASLLAGVGRTKFIGRFLPNLSRGISAIGGPTAIGIGVAGLSFVKALVDNQEKRRLQALDERRSTSFEVFNNRSLPQKVRLQGIIDNVKAFEALTQLEGGRTINEQEIFLQTQKRGALFGTAFADASTAFRSVTRPYRSAQAIQQEEDDIRNKFSKIESDNASEFAKQFIDSSDRGISKFSDALKNSIQSGLNIADSKDVGYFISNFIRSNSADASAIGIVSGFNRRSKFGLPIDAQSIQNSSQSEAFRFLLKEVSSRFSTGATNFGKTNDLIKNINLLDSTFSSLDYSVSNIVRSIDEFDSQVSIASANISGNFATTASKFSSGAINNESLLGLPTINELRSLRIGLPALIAKQTVSSGGALYQGFLSDDLIKRLNTGGTGFDRIFQSLPSFIKRGLETQIEQAFNGGNVDFGNIGSNIESAVNKMVQIIEANNDSLAKSYNERNKLELDNIKDLNKIEDFRLQIGNFAAGIYTLDPSKVFNKTLSNGNNNRLNQLSNLGLPTSPNQLLIDRQNLIDQRVAIQDQIKNDPGNTSLITRLSELSLALSKNTEGLNIVTQSNERQASLIQNRLLQFNQQKEGARQFIQGISSLSYEDQLKQNIGNGLAVQAINGRTNFSPEEISSVFEALDRLRKLAEFNPDRFQNIAGIGIDQINNVQGRITKNTLNSKDKLLLGLAAFQAEGPGKSQEEVRLIAELDRITKESLNVLVTQNKASQQQIVDLDSRISNQIKNFETQLDIAVQQAQNMQTFNDAIDKLSQLINIPNNITMQIQLPDLNVNFSQDLSAIEPHIRKYVNQSIAETLNAIKNGDEVDSP